MSRTPTFQSHSTESELRAYVEESLSAEERQRVERHLTAGCMTCMLEIREILEGNSARETIPGDDREGLISNLPIERSAAIAQKKALLVEVESTLAPSLIAELMLRPPAGRREIVRGSRRYKLLGLSEALREESTQEIRRDIARSLELAELSAEVADCLSTPFYGSRIVADARALAWATVGNGQRVSGDLFGAERTFRSAHDLLDRGTGNPTEKAEVQVLLASLRIQQARFGEAIRLLDEAAATYRALDLRELEGKAIFKMGNAAAMAGEPGRALELFDACLNLLDADASPRLSLWAQHNIAHALYDAGANEEAYAYITSIAPVYERFPEDRMVHVRRRWVEGLILTGVGRTEEGIDQLMDVRRVFVEEERAYDTALVTLDLAGILLEAGETTEVKRLVREMYPVFRSQDVHRQAIAALVLFEQAVTQEAATVALARDVGRYLAQARNNPYLRFEPSGPRAD